MPNNPYAAYLETKVLSATPLQLVHMAYEAAIEAVADARRHVVAKRIAERSKAITRAQMILLQLAKSLDPEKGGDLALRLAKLYSYMLRQLADANFRQVEEPLADVQKLLETLCEAWKEISTPEASLAAVASPAAYAPAETTPRTEYSF